MLYKGKEEVPPSKPVDKMIRRPVTSKTTPTPSTVPTPKPKAPAKRTIGFSIPSSSMDLTDINVAKGKSEINKTVHLSMTKGSDSIFSMLDLPDFEK